jgi:hypothetical protein
MALGTPLRRTLESLFADGFGGIAKPMAPFYVAGTFIRFGEGSGSLAESFAMIQSWE